MNKKVAVVFIFSVSLILAGCSMNKDKIIVRYNNVLNNIGKNVLTNDNELIGERVLNKNTNTGHYKCMYHNCSKQEVLFGSVEVNRKNKNIHLEYDVDVKKGVAKLVLKNNSKVKVMEKFDIRGPEKGEIDIKAYDGEFYIGIICDEFSGKFNIKAEEL